MTDTPKFIKYDMHTWDRSEVYRHYTINAPLPYDLSANINVSGLREFCHANKLRFYIVMTYLTAQLINSDEKYRTAVDPTNGQPGYWETVHPLYTVFNKDTETFTHVWSRYDEDFDTFHRTMEADIEQFGKSTRLYARGATPANNFCLTSLPWISLTGLSFHIQNERPYMIPFLTMGKYFDRDGQRLMPVNVTFHHAVCDGYHAARFFNDLEASVADFITR